MMEKIIEKLTDIGFNKLEAEVYIYLLANPPATAYRIGKEINKPTANVYKAIDSLSVKGAVLLENNKTKLCKAVNPDEFFTLYTRKIADKANQAMNSLKELKKNEYDERSYSIDSVPLVFERFRFMMEKCTHIAVIDAFPKALDKVTDSIKNTIKRGVQVYVEAYSHVEIEGAHIALAATGKKTLEHWKSQQLNLVIDGEEHLIALLDEELENVKQATWSSNVYTSCILHAGRLHEQSIVKLSALMNDNNFEKKAKEILEKQKYFINTHVPGFNKLFELDS